MAKCNFYASQLSDGIERLRQATRLDYRYGSSDVGFANVRPEREVMLERHAAASPTSSWLAGVAENGVVGCDSDQIAYSSIVDAAERS